MDGSAALTNLPILVKIADATYLSDGQVGSNGEGIRFTSDGTTLLDFEIDYYDGDSTDGTVHAWVKIPSLSHNTDTSIWIHYGQTTAQSDAAATANDVWTENGASLEYVVVNHLRNAPDATTSSREMIGSVTGDADDYSAVNMGSSNLVDGKIGKAVDFNDGVSNERICLERTSNTCKGNNSYFDSAQGANTVSLWYKADSVSGTSYDWLFDEGGGGAGQSIYIYDSKVYGCNIQGNIASCAFATTSAGVWHHVALVVTPSGTSYVYHDGVTDSDGTFTARNSVTSTGANALGYVEGKSRSHDNKISAGSGFHGIIDEFRAVSSTLSGEQIKTMYNSESNANFITVGSITTQAISETLSLTDSISKSTDKLLSDTVSFDRCYRGNCRWSSCKRINFIFR